MNSPQSWVETTLPPGYNGHSYYSPTPGHGPTLLRGWCSGKDCREEFATETERNRAAWRHWTAAVLRGRGDVRAEDYGASGGVVWHLAFDGRRGHPSCWTVGTLMSVTASGNAFYVCAHDDELGGVAHRYAEDIDEAMARFAMLVMYDQGPAMKGDKL